MKESVSKKITDFFLGGQYFVLKREEILINAGDEPKGVYYLSSGYVKMNSIFESGSVLTLNIFKPGSFFPMMWALGEVDNAYFYQSMSDVKVYRMPKEEVIEFITKDPEVLFNLTKRVLIGLGGLLTNVQHLLYGSSYSRVVSAFIISAKRFGRSFKNNSVLIDLALTHQDIANLAGITRETASLAIEKLEKKKVITRLHRNYIVKSITLLEKEISDSAK